MCLTNFPLEVIEMIIGDMYFVDLPYFLQTSREIQNLFAASKYHAKYQFIPNEAREEIHKNMKEYPAMWPEWTVGAVLDTYTNPYCANCRDFGYMFMWASIPTKKLCAFCLVTEPLYGHYDLKSSLKDLELAIGDVCKYPILLEVKERPSNLCRFPSRILGETLSNIAVAKGYDVEDVLIYPEDEQNFMNGFIKVSGLFNPQGQNHVVAEIICGHCPVSDPGIIICEADQFYCQVYKDQAYSRKGCALRYLPRTYEALHYHISIRHPTVLSSFEVGWESLSPSLKTSWLSHAPKDDSHNHSEAWMSWAYYAFSKMPVEDWRDTPRKLNSYLAEAMTHEGELFGIPQEKDVFGMSFALVEDDHSYTEISEYEIAERLSTYFQSRILRECEQWLKDTVASGGVGALNPLLEADSILDVISKSRAPNQ